MSIVVTMAKRIEAWPIERLIPYANNARTHSAEQIDKIAASIAEFGFTSPVLVDSKDGIIAGHGRVMAAESLGMEQVPVIILDHLSDAQRRAYIIADNRLALDAGWDDDMLAAELAALQEDGFDLVLTGFDDDEILEILSDAAEPDGGEGGGDEAVSLTANLKVTCMEVDKHDVLRTIERAIKSSGIAGVTVE